MLTAALGDGGKIHWGWDVHRNVEHPEQENVFTLIKNINRIRKQYNEFLHTGKMIKPIPLEDVGIYTLYFKSSYQTQYPSLLTSRWCDQDGNEKQIIVNYLSFEQKCIIRSKNTDYLNTDNEEEKKCISVLSLDAVLV